MLSGLQEFETSTADTKAKRASAFTLLAGRLARQENVPSKTISSIVTAAEKAPEDLLAEIEIARQHLERLAIIESSREVYVSTVDIYTRLTNEMTSIAANEAAICNQIVEVEGQRYRFACELENTTAALNKAMTAEQTARRSLEGAEAYGIDVPTPMPERPQMPSTHMTRQRKEFDTLCHGHVLGRIHDLRMGTRPTPTAFPAEAQPAPTPSEPEFVATLPVPDPEPIPADQSIMDLFLDP